MKPEENKCKCGKSTLYRWNHNTWVTWDPNEYVQMEGPPYPGLTDEISKSYINI